MAKSKKQKRIEAEARQTEYDELSLEDKVRRALRAPGHSRKELEKLRRIILNH
jgi:hypothetical protein